MAEPFSIGSLYLAGFTQARAPHVGIMIPTSATEGILIYILIDRAISPTWTFQTRVQKIAGDMFLSSLLRIAAAGITVDRLKSVAQTVHIPENNEFGEYFPWAQAVVQKLHDEGLLQLKSISGLAKEFNDFATENMREETGSLTWQYPNFAHKRLRQLSAHSESFLPLPPTSENKHVYI